MQKQSLGVVSSSLLMNRKKLSYSFSATCRALNQITIDPRVKLFWLFRATLTTFYDIAITENDAGLQQLRQQKRFL